MFRNQMVKKMPPINPSSQFNSLNNLENPVLSNPQPKKLKRERSEEAIETKSFKKICTRLEFCKEGVSKLIQAFEKALNPTISNIQSLEEFIQIAKTYFMDDCYFLIKKGRYKGSSPLALISYLAYMCFAKEIDIHRLLWDLVEEMIDKNSYVESTFFGATALSYAANAEAYHIVEKIINICPQADFDAHPEGLGSVLWMLCLGRVWSAVEKILANRPQTNCFFKVPGLKETPLAHAALAGEWEIVNRILECNPKASNEELRIYETGMPGNGYQTLGELALKETKKIFSSRSVVSHLLLRNQVETTFAFTTKMKQEVSKIQNLLKESFDQIHLVFHELKLLNFLPEELREAVQVRVLQAYCPLLGSLADEVLVSHLPKETAQ